MADDVSILDATGATVSIATDSVTDATFGSAQVQFVKVISGIDGETYRAGVDETHRAMVSDDQMRRIAEQQQLMQYAEFMRAIDPMHGFEIR